MKNEPIDPPTEKMRNVGWKNENQEIRVLVVLG